MKQKILEVVSKNWDWAETHTNNPKGFLIATTTASVIYIAGVGVWTWAMVKTWL